MKMLLVIHEKDFDDKEQSVIGIADSVKNAEKIIKEYYGEHKEISCNYICDSNLEYSKVLEVKGAFEKSYRVEIRLEWFQLNCA